MVSKIPLQSLEALLYVVSSHCKPLSIFQFLSCPRSKQRRSPELKQQQLRPRPSGATANRSSVLRRLLLPFTQIVLLVDEAK
ncbi:hypothetical protein Taro_000448 [Colocasia esculenta]|uniref:Uncharacterized protein n=1 Tax=Colocasia esculenta TaxID=4460 RepID=A0A843T7X7_COLES|nr:hypothetical protein [Colocasia esculenta]